MSASKLVRFNDVVLLTTDPRIAAQQLLAGHLCAVPTETVYGLAARADNPAAVARIYAVKQRPADHPLIVHVADADAAWTWARDVPDYAHALALRCWPGPMTLVLPRAEHVGDFVTGGQDSVALRVSAHPMMHQLFAQLAALNAASDSRGKPDDGLNANEGLSAIGLAAPSANRFGRVSPTTALHVIDELGPFTGDDDAVLDGGPCTVGVESTIIDCTGPSPVILRTGAITEPDVVAISGLPLASSSTVRASGTLASHYAPHAIVHAVGSADHLPVASGNPIGLLALADIGTPAGYVRLSAPDSVDAYAAVLYAALREADALQLSDVWAVLPPAAGIGAAIADRLARAAHGH